MVSQYSRYEKHDLRDGLPRIVSTDLAMMRQNSLAVSPDLSTFGRLTAHFREFSVHSILLELDCCGLPGKFDLNNVLLD